MTIRRLRLEYVVLLERLEEKALMVPDGISELEEMSPPPSPSILDDSLSIADADLSKTTLSKKGKRFRRLAPANAAKVNKIRDPDLPKRPTNAYLIFCEMEKERIKQEIEAKHGLVSDLSRTMTEAWKNLDQEKRAPYYKLYEDDRERYKREMEVYNRKKLSEDTGEDFDEPAVKRQKTDTAASETPEVVVKVEGSDSLQKNDEMIDDSPSEKTMDEFRVGTPAQQESQGLSSPIPEANAPFLDALQLSPAAEENDS